MRTEEWKEKAVFIAKLRELTERLNRCRAAYVAHTPLVSDEVYDMMRFMTSCSVICRRWKVGWG